MRINTMHTGVVKFFNVGRLYGFITDEETGRDYFCHNNGLICHIKKGDKVTFDLAACSKGVEAVNVTLVNTNKPLTILCDGDTNKTE